MIPNSNSLTGSSLLAAALLISAAPGVQADWARFRGPNGSLAYCRDAKTGEEIYTERLPGGSAGPSSGGGRRPAFHPFLQAALLHR